MCVCTFYWERQLYKIYDNTAYTTQIICTYDILVLKLCIYYNLFFKFTSNEMHIRT